MKCSSCGEPLLETDIFCPKCRTKKIPDISLDKKIDKAFTTVGDILLSLLAIPILIFGIGFITQTIIVAFIKIQTAFLSSIIGMIAGMILGGIVYKIGEFVLKQIKTENIKTCIATIALIGGIILGIIMYPSLLEKVNLFY